ncbi:MULTISPECIES: MgtC/SapB family protein [Pediococcus]|jgi:putative Mg2+ transporter-C (MgtC) family protein|uniref:MgtC/SapB family protein n=2 Tax=Pediococcus parvulus TaxID=54062 RepID=A0AAP5TAT0_9LACO|nr:MULTISPECIES: MgtC/SapB family protein [Pediococcus]MCT3027328.1 MgtC/SapB family protein [Pediococcus parvulus]MCT3029189.1 MgtC/SapB family protein [Pediococcus parvulus]MCT3030942.1 MgtC/SapB family protein [Pediococcus parvulus]MCT3034818.1 MgtC/SapB family protein [Pediococcus parvulus]MDV7693616.1 MgtC/SapB family protein [Pediococcus parvulus]
MNVTTQLDLILRVLIAGACGFAIGYERDARAKTAGLRTHIIIAVGAALMMIVSKYGFMDVLGNKGFELDPSRIAAQIVSGIGFIGAGTIIVKHEDVNGLTTATGLWTTAGIGMAIGARMYVVGIISALLVLGTQVMLHRNLSWLRLPNTNEIRLQVKPGDHHISIIQKRLQAEDVEVTSMHVRRTDEVTVVHLAVQSEGPTDMEKLTAVLETMPQVVDIEIY